jgi:hypothetical protein
MHGAPATASVKSMTMTYYMHPPGLIRSGGVVVDAFACCRVTIASRAATSPTASPSPSPMAAVVPGEAAEACPCRCDCRRMFPRRLSSIFLWTETDEAGRSRRRPEPYPSPGRRRTILASLARPSVLEGNRACARARVCHGLSSRKHGTWPRSSFRKHLGSWFGNIYVPTLITPQVGSRRLLPDLESLRHGALLHLAQWRQGRSARAHRVARAQPPPPPRHRQTGTAGAATMHTVLPGWRTSPANQVLDAMPMTNARITLPHASPRWPHLEGPYLAWL